MSTNVLCGAGLGAVFMLLVQSNPAAALSTTFMSGTGNDANPCTRTQPCKTVQGAYSKTDAGGEIFALEAGAYGGGLQILKSITITGVDGASVGDIYINAGPQDVVTLTSLHFEPTVNSALRMVAGGKLLVDDCLIDSNGDTGVEIDPSTNTQTIISNCRISHNQNGIRVIPDEGKVASLTLNNVQIDFSEVYALYVSGGGDGIAILNNSTIIYNKYATWINGTAKVYSLGNNVIVGANNGPNPITPLAQK